MSQLICQEFQRLGLPIPCPAAWLAEEGGSVVPFEEKAHPAGTTRLSVNPKEGVVDANLQVHNVRGLFVAGSSVFPTSGAANPTLMIVALSLRLADWLKSTYLKSNGSVQSKVYPIIESSYVKAKPRNSHAPIRVGLIGAGERILDTYLPVLTCLSSHYEIVGFTTRSTHTSRSFESRTGVPAFTSPQN